MRNKQSQRQAYGEELVALGAENQRVVVLEADLGNSTMSRLFGDAYPERYFDMGIAEQNMLSTAGGLAAAGKIAFCSSFAVFSTGRPYDQIRQSICIGKLNVKICGSSAGLSDFGDGASHQSVEDLALMSALPNMTVFTPCDANETRQAVRAAAAIDGPVYLRIMRNLMPDFIPADSKLLPGEFRVLRSGCDVAIFAHGTMVERAMDAASILEKACISAQVINVSTLKPFDSAAAESIASSVKAVIAAEEHSYHGGLSAALALALRKSATPMDYVAIEDVFGQSAHSAEQLLCHYGLTAEAIADKARKLLV
ncbi:MAG: transketolase family protein [Oscillospiraceae bacterium]|jgi:transketolase|nr:transketolase family protein [Oscillospiraceae bacterium]